MYTSIAARILKVIAKSNGCVVHDVSSNIDNIEFYRDCDLHIGFRVHAHVFFASIRKPTSFFRKTAEALV